MRAYIQANYKIDPPGAEVFEEFEITELATKTRGFSLSKSLIA